MSVQIKLLRILEERKFERVGGNETIEVDIRLIAATNSDLKALVREGEFREDLFFRLDVVTVNLPPLRERLDDVPLLCSAFLAEFSRQNNRPISGITPDAVNVLASYSWPGNVRELRNTIEKMVVFSRGEKLTVRDVPAPIRDAVRNEEERGLPRIAGMASSHSLADAERAMIFAALDKHGNNRTKAAEELGISRRTLHRKLRQYREEEGEAAAEGAVEGEA